MKVRNLTRNQLIWILTVIIVTVYSVALTNKQTDSELEPTRASVAKASDRLAQRKAPELKWLEDTVAPSEKDGLKLSLRRKDDNTWILTLRNEGEKRVFHVIENCGSSTRLFGHKIIDGAKSTTPSPNLCRSRHLHKWGSVTLERGKPLKWEIYRSQIERWVGSGLMKKKSLQFCVFMTELGTPLAHQAEAFQNPNSNIDFVEPENSYSAPVIESNRLEL